MICTPQRATTMLHRWNTPRSARNRLSRLLSLHKLSTNMNNTQAPLDFEPITVDVEVWCGLTDWKLSSDTPPPCRGWWKTRDAHSIRRTPNQRRWWNGKFWSTPVFPNTPAAFDHVDLLEDAEEFKSLLPNDRIEWCGLEEPHPAGYPYKLHPRGTADVETGSD